MLWCVDLTLTAIDLTDGRAGVLIAVAALASVPAATLTILAWLQWHLPAIATAFEIGVSAGELKAERRNVISLPRQEP